MTDEGLTRVRVQAEDFDPGREIEWLGSSGQAGAAVTFVGLVRADVSADTQHPVTALELEHYPAMTEASIADIVQQARQHWPLLAVSVIHRIGRLPVGDRIVFVGVTSAHRGNAFAACEFVMDYLKTRAPFWKKEWRGDENSQWLDARESDQHAAARWFT